MEKCYIFFNTQHALDRIHQVIAFLKTTGTILMHLGIWELQGNKNWKLTKILAMKKLTRQSPLPLTLKLVVLMVFQRNSSNLWFLVKMIQINLVKIIVIISSGFKCLKVFINRIWNGDFSKSWNNVLIVSIHIKDDPSDCNNYRVISPINNGLKIMAKIIANRISKYGIDNGFIIPEQCGFRNRKERISLYTTLIIICQRRKFENKDT